MKGYRLIKPFEVVETEFNSESVSTSCSKVRIVKALLTINDVLRFNGTINCNDVVLGSVGIGIVSETDTNLLEIEKGKRIYIQTKRGCGDCYRCKEGNKAKCLSPLTAGEDFDGFLTDFINVENDYSYSLPESIKDTEALFIDTISLALNIIDKLSINKGDYVTIVGANNLGFILAQLLIYYQAVPILITNKKEDLEIAKKSGIYYTLDENDEWAKEISIITSNRMSDKIIYISDSNIAISKAFSIASQNANVVYTGSAGKTSPVSFVTAVKKQLNIICVNSGFGNIESSINLITNHAIDFTNLKMNTIKYADVVKTLEEMNSSYKNNGTVIDTIVEMI